MRSCPASQNKNELDVTGRRIPLELQARPRFLREEGSKREGKALSLLFMHSYRARPRIGGASSDVRVGAEVR